MMNNIFLILILISFAALFLGLFKPGSVLKWGKTKNRKRVLATYIPAILIFFIFFAITAPAEDNFSQKNDQKIQSEITGKSTDDQQSTGTVAEVKNDSIQKNESQISNDFLKVHFIDVGQADSILVQNGTHSMLIDAGNNADGDLVTDYIRQQGIEKLDIVVGTHPHEDHIGGLDNVINSFPIGKLYMPKVTNNTNTFRDVISAIQDNGFKITVPVSGNSFKLGDAECIILAPNRIYEDLNNNSAVIKLTYGNTAFLFGGDAEEQSESDMLGKGCNLSANVLKIGHHGSRSSTSEAFLSKVHPQYAVISVGSDNDYGHPHQELMAKLSNEGIIVYRTDDCGTIIATSDGQRITFNTYPGSN